MTEWKMLPGRHRGEACAEGHRCCAERIMHGHTFTLTACPTCSPATSPYKADKLAQASEFIDAILEDHSSTQAALVGEQRQVERLKAALADEQDRADRMRKALDWYRTLDSSVPGYWPQKTQTAALIGEHAAARQAAQ